MLEEPTKVCTDDIILKSGFTLNKDLQKVFGVVQLYINFEDKPEFDKKINKILYSNEEQKNLYALFSKDFYVINFVLFKLLEDIIFETLKVNTVKNITIRNSYGHSVIINNIKSNSTSYIVFDIGTIKKYL